MMANKILRSDDESLKLRDIYCFYISLLGYSIIGFSIFCLYITISKFSFSIDSLFYVVFTVLMFIAGYMLSKSMGYIVFTCNDIYIFRRWLFGNVDLHIDLASYQYMSVGRTQTTHHGGPTVVCYEVLLVKSSGDSFDLERYWISKLSEDISFFLKLLIDMTGYDVKYIESYSGEFEKLKASLKVTD
jgi:hypothetical protein